MFQKLSYPLTRSFFTLSYRGCRCVCYKDEINLALAGLRYTGNIDASGDGVVTVTSSDGYLERNASSIVRVAWPTGAATRPPTLSFMSPTMEMPEDESILLAPVRVRFGDGQSVVQGRVQCSAGTFALGKAVGDGGGSVVVTEGGEGESIVVLRGLPSDVATALSEVAFAPPKDWSSRTMGVVALAMEVQPVEDGEVSFIFACNFQ